ncbi:hypothetical protein A6R68_21652, partial [Neotoma lepida]
ALFPGQARGAKRKFDFITKTQLFHSYFLAPDTNELIKINEKRVQKNVGFKDEVAAVCDPNDGGLIDTMREKEPTSQWSDNYKEEMEMGSKSSSSGSLYKDRLLIPFPYAGNKNTLELLTRSQYCKGFANAKMEPREATGKGNLGGKRKNLAFLRPRMYMLERRKTDTVVDSSVSGDHSGTLRRSQSDRTEYNQKLQEKMTPQTERSSAETQTPEEEQQMRRMMAKRAKIIGELIQTERDYVTDLELCVREVVQPLRNKQIQQHYEIQAPDISE